MRNTPRGLNRVLLALVGLVLLAAGALVAAAGFSADVSQGWLVVAQRRWDDLVGLVRSTPMPGGEVSWISLGLLVVLVALVVLMLVWIFSQGGGRTNQVAIGFHDGDLPGRTRIRTSLVADAVDQSLDRDEQVLSSQVSSWKAGNADGLNIRLQVRKGVWLSDTLATARDLVTGLDRLTGTRVPVLVRISSGARARLSRTERVQ
ncbi:hypothetical protein GCM10011512_01610 [Tersicoccus solisilvae]|uniref:Alkaline shock response membrane anchor protein AmaP n=1 Tax=Tersicoccus solisilvae TaxID=1882339 RepID=A0ABQ1NJD8_9MICC|nr:hypothetical protein [Tersicoccus solisilvae]GGC78682.1 hypothetical protein GCM10011512_01610 [Tersicoccus solisilvae]